MKKSITFVYLLIAIIFQSCSNSDENSNIEIIGNLKNNSEYQGGAAPPQSLLDQLAIYNNSVNQTFYVRSGSQNTPFTPILTSFTTDANGDFNLNLPVGIYSVITQRKFHYEQTLNSDSTCEWIRYCYSYI